jgi:hypothetical protein
MGDRTGGLTSSASASPSSVRLRNKLGAITTSRSNFGTNATTTQRSSVGSSTTLDYVAAFALALSGDRPQSRALAEDLAREFPEDTQARAVFPRWHRPLSVVSIAVNGNTLVAGAFGLCRARSTLPQMASSGL